MATVDLKHIFDGAIEHIRAHPADGQGTAVTRTRIREGVTCDVADSHWRLIVDEMPGDGGSGLGPDPGVYGRAALGSCLAMGYALWAAHFDVPLDDVEVIVEADYDAQGMLGVDDAVSPGWSAVRYKVSITSPAPRERVLEVIETADRYSSILDCLKRPLDVTREIEISAPAP
jgi:uncharacterized OsmC-like protein